MYYKRRAKNLDAVLKTTCYLSDINDFAAFNEVYKEFFVKRIVLLVVALQ
ncbi:Rid family hydrolase [Vibrio lentus]|nr:Rid family hydrolase [Vibrio lentus]